MGISRLVAYAYPKTVQEFDSLVPHATHLAGCMSSHIGEIPVLFSHDIRLVARGEVGVLLQALLAPRSVHDGFHLGVGTVGTRPRLAGREIARQGEESPNAFNAVHSTDFHIFISSL